MLIDLDLASARAVDHFEAESASPKRRFQTVKKQVTDPRLVTVGRHAVRHLLSLAVDLARCPQWPDHDLAMDDLAR